MWDFGQYNLVVKQVEGCSDILRDTAGRCRAWTVRDRISHKLEKHLLQAAKLLDVRALRMLALYDAAAAQMLKDGVTYDPRRDLFRSPSAHAPAPKGIAAPKKAPKTKKAKP